MNKRKLWVILQALNYLNEDLEEDDISGITNEELDDLIEDIEEEMQKAP
jgi:hypothetical protein